MNLWLSQVVLEAAEASRKQLNDSYHWHKASWEAFPGRPDSDRNFLTRVDPSPEGFRLLLLSQVEPVRPDWCPEPSWQSKAVAETFLKHERYRFDLHANPTKKIRVGHDGEGTRKKNGKRVPVTSEDELRSWLSRKAEAGGFRVIESSETEISKPFRQPFRKNGVMGHHAGVAFKGILKVAELSSFQETFCNGIGSAKAFGFGMLVLEPLAS
jgi:CRISPR system Cascade subunit CasE